MAARAGLSSSAAAARLAADGPNAIRATRNHETLRLLIAQFTSPIVLILFIATIISMITGEVRDSIIILGILIPSGLLGFWQEYQASNTMKALLKRVRVNCTVMRDGDEIQIPVEDVVVGDIVVLTAGNIIPADLKIFDAHKLMTDESALTGEPFPVEKTNGDEVFFGTSVVSGRALAEVLTVGSKTKYGELVAEMNSADVQTSFEKGTRSYGVMLMWAMLVLVSVLVIARLFMHRPLIESLLFALALAVGLTPEMLPVIVSVSLAAGARVMAKQGVIVKRLDAIEDFGSMTALCTDKTGTITLGQVELAEFINIDNKSDGEVGRLATLNAALQQGFVNPLDDAILKRGLPLDSAITLREEIPYDFTRRRLTVATSAGEVITKGAYKEVLDVCTKSASAHGDVELHAARAAWDELFEKYSKLGMRVLAIASKNDSTDTITEQDFTMRGLLIFNDPPKADAVAAIQEMHDLGIDVFIITGDNPVVAKALAAQVGVKSEKVITGSELATLSQDELHTLITDTRIFASVNPLQKKDIIVLLQDAGHTVGFFGDGINDAAALRAADVGISVGNAVDVAKSAAAIVLMTKDLGVVAHGVKLGRRTFVNTLKYIKVTISANFGNMLSMAISSFFLPFLPMLPSQILLLNFMSDFPDLAIATDRVDEDDIKSPRLWDVKEIRNFMIVFGVVSTCFDLPVFAMLTWVFDVDPATFRTAWFVESTMTELVAMMVLRTTLPFWKSRASKLLSLSTLVLAITVTALPFIGIGAAVDLVPLSWSLLAAIFGVIFTYIIANEVTKYFYYRRHKVMN